MSRVSQNGWVASAAVPLDRSPIPGTSVRIPQGVRTGGVATVLHYVAREFHTRVEPLIPGHCWGFAYREVRGGSALSNHASGTAIDLNAPAHPLGRSGTFNPSQVATIREILSEVEGVVRWGGDYRSRKDEMHFEINASAATVARVAQRLNRKEPSVKRVGPLGFTATLAVQNAINVQDRQARLAEDGIWGPRTAAAVRRNAHVVRALIKELTALEALIDSGKV